MSTLLSPYLLASLANRDNEALKLLIERPDASSLINYSQIEMPSNQAIMALLFKQLFEAAKNIETNIKFYEQESRSIGHFLSRKLKSCLVHWHLKRFGTLPPLSELLKPPFYYEIKELKQRKQQVAKQIGVLFGEFFVNFESDIKSLIIEEFLDGETKDLVQHICEIGIPRKEYFNYKSPSFWQRNKSKVLLSAIGIYGGYLLIKHLDWNKVINSLLDLGKVSRNLLNDWIFEPLVGVWNTIRYSKKDFEIVKIGDLDSDKEALNKMMQELGFRDQANEYELLLNEYEKALKKPIREALFGICSF